MSNRRTARQRIASVESRRPRQHPPIVVTLAAAGGEDRTEAVVAWLARFLATRREVV